MGGVGGTGGAGGTGGVGGQGGTGGQGGAGGVGGVGGMGGAGGIGGEGGEGGAGGMGGAGGGGSMGLHFVVDGSYPAAVGAGNTALRTADMDGDGKLDLVVTNTSGGFIGVLRGNGDGTFQEIHRAQFESITVNVAVADMNGDGKPDVVATNSFFGTPIGVFVALNQGDGSLMAPQQYATGSTTPGAFAPTDIDADGDIDIVVSRGSGGIDVLTNAGDGKLTLAATYSTSGGTHNIFAVAAGDVDGDGFVDVVATSSSTSNVSWLWKGTGGGALATGVTLPSQRSESIVLVDLTGDGKLDVVVGPRQAFTTGYGVLVNNGNGTFAPMVKYANEADAEIEEIKDVDGDGQPDVLLAHRFGGAYVLKNTGGGALSDPIALDAGRNPKALAAGDVDGDGDTDIVSGNDGPGISVVRGDGMGSFLAPLGVPYGVGARQSVAADFDGDGHKDIVFSHVAAVNTILRGKAGGGFEPAGSNDVLEAPIGLFAFPADENPSLDLVAALPGGNDEGYVVQTFPNTGGLSFGPSIPSYPGFFGAGSTDVGDTDGDGDLDILVVADTNNGGISLRNNGDGTFSDAEYLFTDAVAIADFNEDGKLDFAGAGEFVVFFQPGNGDGTFANAPEYLLVDDIIGHMAAGDVNGDGHADFVATHAQGDGVVLMLGVGDGTFIGTTFMLGLGIAHNPVLEDLDEDGDEDLVVLAGGRVNVLLWEGDFFTAGPTIGEISRPTSVSASDVTGDGRPDLLVTSNTTNSLVVLRNTN
ncbi:VCBS repeat-containing protein [Polyangium jinanense]|uniref:VCBS repeat-containing protein n=2 Tax=Polyangium jinanense TaxID=2829994 RepID=A0A9X3X6B0_9BACT|nr:VCBS repeat-containing protein [Polyangium jinanense]